MAIIDNDEVRRSLAGQVKDVAWRDLARRIQGRILRPSDSQFSPLAVPANARYERISPQGIVLPATEADIAVAVDWAREVRLPIVARGGGHSYAGHSTTDGLLVHLGALKAGAVDTTARTATVQAGVQNRDVLELAGSTGLTFPFGRCPTIGIAGYTLGGGIGLHTRRIGMASDNLLSTRVVTADGSILHCDENTNADLFWACRGGGGGNFGINTQFTFQLHPTSRVTAFKLAFNGKRAAGVLLAMQDLITEPSLLRSFSAQFGIKTLGINAARAADNVTLYAEGWYYGTRSELEIILSRVISISRPTSMRLSELHALRAQRYFSDEVASDPFMTTSIVARNVMSEQDAACIVENLRTWPGSSSASGASVGFFAMGGADRDLKSDATAFVHRDAVFILAVTSRWAVPDSETVPAQANAWINRFRTDLNHTLGSSSFINFPDPTLPRWWDSYYGSNYERLIAAKRTYDPTGLFRHAQGVGTHSASRQRLSCLVDEQTHHSAPVAAVMNG